jgi:hypothetical protein
LAETERDLQGRGAARLYEVVEGLRTSMADAVDTRGTVHRLVHGEDGLYATTRRHIAEARRAYERAAAAAESGDACVPDDLAERVAASHREAAVADARGIGARVTDAIGSYRHRMVDRAGELLTAGYDVTDGPLDLWITPDNARFAAARVREELARLADDPHRADLEHLLRHLAQLRSIVERARVSCDGWGVTPEEYRYLDAFYHEVGGGEAFTRLGEVLRQRSDLKLDPGDDSRLTVVAEAFADGMLTAYGRDSVRMPDSLAELFKVYSWREDGDAWRDFERFGAVLQYGTVKPSDRMVDDLVSTAIVGIRSQHDNEGSDGVLHAALLNLDSAADWIGDYDNYWAERKLAESRERQHAG